MAAAILFDFFGTLVHYDPSRTSQGYARTHALLTELGAALGHTEFLSEWDDTAARFETACDEDDHEFSMAELGAAFLAASLPFPPTAARVQAFVASYLAEWTQGVNPIPGVAELLAELATDHRLAVVTNTHSSTMVPSLLRGMGVDHLFEAVITSVEVGWRKPHRAIYEATLAALDLPASDCTFVGDTRLADYVGPRSMGMSALLIDPDRTQVIPNEDRIGSVLDLPARLNRRGAMRR